MKSFYELRNIFKFYKQVKVHKKVCTLNLKVKNIIYLIKKLFEY